MSEIIKYETEFKPLISSGIRPNVAPVDITRLPKAATGFISKIVQYAQLGKDMLDALNPDEVLIVNIPKEIKEDIDRGIAWLNEKKDGSGVLPQVMGVSDSGRKTVKKILTIESEKRPSNDLRRSLTQDLNSIYLQQQLPAMAAQLEETLDCVYQIKQGQKDNRFGAIHGATNQIRFALDTQNKAALQLGMSSLQDSTGVLGESLKTLVASFEKVPNSKPKLIGKMVFSMGYASKKQDELNEIVQYFDLYEKAQEVLIIAAYLTDGENGARSILSQRRAFLESLQLANLRTLKHLLPASISEHLWIDEVNSYIQDSEVNYIHLVKGCYDSIELKVTAGQLQEAVEDDETSES